MLKFIQLKRLLLRGSQLLLPFFICLSAFANPSLNESPVKKQLQKQLNEKPEDFSQKFQETVALEFMMGLNNFVDKNRNPSIQVPLSLSIQFPVIKKYNKFKWLVHGGTGLIYIDRTYGEYFWAKTGFKVQINPNAKGRFVFVSLTGGPFIIKDNTEQIGWAGGLMMEYIPKGAPFLSSKLGIQALYYKKVASFGLAFQQGIKFKSWWVKK